MGTASHNQGHASSALPTTADDLGRANKVIRRHENAEQRMQEHELISALPDEILVHMLSLMPIKEAVSTGCLSSRWKHLWKHIPNLMLNTRSVGVQREPQLWEWDERAVEFIVIVNSILRHRHGTRIESFSLDFPLASNHAPEVDRWVALIAESGTKKLKLKLAWHSMDDVEDVEPYDFPSQCFTGGRGSSLRNLILWNCNLSCSPGCLDGFTSLKYLSLTQVSVNDMDVSNILSTCSALTLFQLKKCYELVHLRVCHARLHQFYVELCSDLESISIHAKKLFDFAYMGHKVDMVYDSAPVLRTLKIQFMRHQLMTENECPLDCVGVIPTLRTLLLQFSSPLTGSPALQHYRTFAGLKEVTLHFLTPWDESILLATYLLIAAPLVKRFQLEAFSALQAPKDLTIIWPEHVSLESLRHVVIGGFSGETELIELALFLLRRSPALKTLEMYTHHLGYRGGQQWSREVAEDPIRCYYARGVALTHLAPKMPSTVKFTIE